MSGGWSETSIFSFTAGKSGCDPVSGVTFDAAGNLYGTTPVCGAYNLGTVYKLTPTRGQWTLSVLHTFTGGADGGNSNAGLNVDSRGTLYGTTTDGGLFGEGVVFKLTPAKGGRRVEAEYSFIAGTGDGANPYSGLTFGKDVVFGTTYSGGANDLGTIYEISAK